MARNSKHATVTIDEAAGAVNFKFADGTLVAVGIDNYPADLVKRMALHGFNQKLRDSYAGAESIAEARESFNKVLAALDAGKWSTRGEGDGAPVGQFARAVQILIARKTGNEPSMDEVRAKLAGLDDEKKKALKTSAPIVEILAELAKAKATTANADEILGI